MINREGEEVSKTQDPIASVHFTNTADGSYDVMLPLPYPFHIEADGSVGRQDFWRGTPKSLLGFMFSPDRFEIDIEVCDWLTGDVDVVGMYAVTQDANGSISTWTFPISAVTK